jgi:hypothetical protein
MTVSGIGVAGSTKIVRAKQKSTCFGGEYKEALAYTNQDKGRSVK